MPLCAGAVSWSSPPSSCRWWSAWSGRPPRRSGTRASSFIFSGTWNPDPAIRRRGLHRRHLAHHRPGAPPRRPRRASARRPPSPSSCPAAWPAALDLRRPAGGGPEHRRRTLGPLRPGPALRTPRRAVPGRRSLCSNHLFGGGDLGSGILLASVVLAVMILPDPDRPHPHGPSRGVGGRPRGGAGPRRHQVAGRAPGRDPGRPLRHSRPPSPWPWAEPWARPSPWPW